MLAFLGGLLRVVVGFVLACLAAGAVQVLFAVTPAELIDAGTDYWSQGGLWVLESATILGIFALPFVVPSIILSEWLGVRSFAYHGFIGIAIAIGGFGAITMGESPDTPSIINSYAMAAFLTTGLVGGFIYWLFAGRFARRSRTPAPVAPPLTTSTAKPIAPNSPLQTKPGGPANPSTGTVPATKPAQGSVYDA